MTATDATQVNSRLRAQFGMLTAQFLLGMAVNLIGLPDETAGFAHLASNTLLIAHLLVAIGLLIGAGQIIKHADQIGRPLSLFARTGAAGIGLAILSGILTLSAPWSNLWSYLMAVGFIGSMISYGRLWVLSAARR